MVSVAGSIVGTDQSGVGTTSGLAGGGRGVGLGAGDGGVNLAGVGVADGVASGSVVALMLVVGSREGAGLTRATD